MGAGRLRHSIEARREHHEDSRPASDLPLVTDARAQYSDTDAELLTDLADQRSVRLLARLHLAARQLPEPGIATAGSSPRQEYFRPAVRGLPFHEGRHDEEGALSRAHALR
jgi:hypothetical protein